MLPVILKVPDQVLSLAPVEKNQLLIATAQPAHLDLLVHKVHPVLMGKMGHLGLQVMMVYQDIQVKRETKERLVKMV